MRFRPRLHPYATFLLICALAPGQCPRPCRCLLFCTLVLACYRSLSLRSLMSCGSAICKCHEVFLGGLSSGRTSR